MATEKIRQEFEDQDMPGVVVIEVNPGLQWSLQDLPAKIYFYKDLNEWASQWRDGAPHHSSKLEAVIHSLTQQIDKEFERLRIAKGVMVIHRRN